jgi:hypothetical protein
MEYHLMLIAFSYTKLTFVTGFALHAFSVFQVVAPQLGLDLERVTKTDLTKDTQFDITAASVPHDSLSLSPSFGFSHSVDELTTPDDMFAAQDSLSFVQGLTSVNYDRDLSDLSADNSCAEDIPAADGCKSSVVFPLEEKCIEDLTPSLLDTTESPTGILLPSPIKPVCSGEYQGFAAQGWHIPSIPCETGDVPSLNSDTCGKMDSPFSQVSVDGRTVDSVASGVRSVSQVEETLVKVLSVLMTTFDSLF